ncbi:hypothetical protein SALWKB29_0067 [Snodgrassella communis]|uniref:Uncharacterized protein n=1 Tax=Snodgrassella communis TaxID=2946699 RepID=A0A836MR72_9NEIS|nr:hypothetical protein SALWKB29_0067 [Snodgrassella communis]
MIAIILKFLDINLSLHDRHFGQKAALYKLVCVFSLDFKNVV